MKPTVGLALTGSFCTIGEVLRIAETFKNDYTLIPIVSYHVSELETRFFAAGEIRDRLLALTGQKPICTLPDAEPIGPQKLLDLLVIAPCTGNTLSKLAWGITDTPVTLAAKAHLRNRRPLLLAPATNDALAASAKSIGQLFNTKHVFFVPFSQDDPKHKETSLVSDFSRLKESIDAALLGRQVQPVLS